MSIEADFLSPNATLKTNSPPKMEVRMNLAQSALAAFSAVLDPDFHLKLRN
jgi:hypothetical protein